MHNSHFIFMREINVPGCWALLLNPVILYHFSKFSPPNIVCLSEVNETTKRCVATRQILFSKNKWNFSIHSFIFLKEGVHFGIGMYHRDDFRHLNLESMQSNLNYVKTQYSISNGPHITSTASASAVRMTVIMEGKSWLTVYLHSFPIFI